jgi:hypothetical protein
MDERVLVALEKVGADLGEALRNKLRERALEKEEDSTALARRFINLAIKSGVPIEELMRI